MAPSNHDKVDLVFSDFPLEEGVYSLETSRVWLERHKVNLDTESDGYYVRSALSRLILWAFTCRYWLSQLSRVISEQTFWFFGVWVDSLLV